MPIRRVFGTTVFVVREAVDMPRPGEMRAGSFQVSACSIRPGALVYGPIARAVGARRARASTGCSS